MATETLVNLRTRIRERSDQSTIVFITDAELNRLVNESYREYYDLVLESHADHYLAAPASFTLAAGVNTYSLANFTAFYRLRGIDLVEGSQYKALRRYVHQERNDARCLSYRVMGGSIYFNPPEQAPGSYRAWFIPEPTALSADSDTVDGFNGWEAWIVADAAAKIAEKAEEDPGPYIRDRDRIAERIRKAATDRDEGDPERVTDVKRLGFFDGDW